MNQPDFNSSFLCTFNIVPKYSTVYHSCFVRNNDENSQCLIQCKLQNISSYRESYNDIYRNYCEYSNKNIGFDACIGSCFISAYWGFIFLQTHFSILKRDARRTTITHECTQRREHARTHGLGAIAEVSPWMDGLPLNLSTVCDVTEV